MLLHYIKLDHLMVKMVVFPLLGRIFLYLHGNDTVGWGHVCHVLKTTRTEIIVQIDVPVATSFPILGGVSVELITALQYDILAV